MNTFDLQNLLQEVIDEAIIEGTIGEDMRVKTFEEDGIMTYDAGLVIRTKDGSEFQVTIVKSR